jgi:hypothetical protein
VVAFSQKTGFLLKEFEKLLRRDPHRMGFMIRHALLVVCHGKAPQRMGRDALVILTQIQVGRMVQKLQ